MLFFVTIATEKWRGDDGLLGSGARLFNVVWCSAKCNISAHFRCQ